MTFGADGVLYWAQHTAHPYGWLTTINTTTGVPTKIGTLGHSDKLTCLFQKRSLVKTFPLAVTDLKAVNDEVKHNQVTLTWTLPTKNAGKTQFQKVWGNRKLEDDWRRRNKNVFALNDTDTGDSDSDNTKRHTTPL